MKNPAIDKKCLFGAERPENGAREGGTEPVLEGWKSLDGQSTEERPGRGLGPRPSHWWAGVGRAHKPRKSA